MTTSAAAYQSGRAERAVAAPHFQAEGNEAARFVRCVWLEREHPDAFLSGEALERALAEVEHGKYCKAQSGDWRVITRGEPRRRKLGIRIAFPSMMALSFMS